ncbi:MAG: MFS transporter [Rectinemataceae bacterium]
MPDKRLFRIIPCSFFVSLAVGIVSLGMLFLIKGDYGAGPAVVGWFTALSAAAYFAGCLVFRPLSHRINASVSIILMCFISAIFLAAQFLLPSLAGAFVAYSLHGLASALIWPRIMGWLTSGLESHALSRASGSFSLSWSVGMTLAPFIAGTLSERGGALGYGRALPIYVGVALFFATGLFMLASSSLAPAPRPSFVDASRDRAATDVAATEVATDHSTPLRYPGWIGLFAIYVLYSVLANIFPLYAKDELALSESAIGLLLLIRAATMTAGFWIFGRLRFWQFKPIYLPLSLAANVILDIAFIFIRTPSSFVLGLALAGVVQSFSYSLSIFYGASGAADRDKRMSVHEAVLTIGQILGSVGGGAAFQSISWPIIFVFSAALAFLCIPFQIVFLRKR